MFWSVAWSAALNLHLIFQYLQKKLKLQFMGNSGEDQLSPYLSR